MNDTDKVTTWEANAVADTLFGPEGGIAVWVRRPEIGARAAVRRAGDLVVLATEVAAMLGATSSLAAGLAKQHGITFDEFMEMVEKAGEVLQPITGHAVRIKPISGGKA